MKSAAPQLHDRRRARVRRQRILQRTMVEHETALRSTREGVRCYARSPPSPAGMAARGYDYFRSPPVRRQPEQRSRAFFGEVRARGPTRRAPPEEPLLLAARTACERVLNAKLDADHRDRPPRASVLKQRQSSFATTCLICVYSSIEYADMSLP